jgi:translation elongation factor P/translation initiation factor 5A
MRHLTAVLFAVFTLSLATSAAHARAPMAAAAEGVSFTARAKIVALDVPGRVVTVKASDGKQWTFKVSKDVQNLDQVKVGDTIVVKGFAAVAVALKGPKSGPAGAEVDEAAVRAAKGQLPAGAEVEQVTLQAKIKAIDAKKQAVTLEDPSGKMATVKVKDAKALTGLKVGDDVSVTFIEGYAIAVEPPAKKKAKK